MITQIADDITLSHKDRALIVELVRRGLTLGDTPRLPAFQPGPQTEFGKSQADIVIYGGSAGGGKSFGLLLDAAKDVANSEYGFVIFRRTSPQIKNQGGLWDDSQKLYPRIGGVGTKGNLTWKFPSGAKCQFRHLQHESTVLDWQGSQVPYIGFDELTHFSEAQFFYMLSRNRSAAGLPCQVRATTNPSPGWVKRLLAPWLDKNRDVKAQSGEILYFVRVKGEIIWVDKDYRLAQSEEELAADLTDVEREEMRKPKSITFIRSSVYDNIELLRKDPGYITNLKSLPDAERRRLLDGDWDIFEGSFFEEWSEALHVETPRYRKRTVDGPLAALPSHWEYFGGLDWGYSVKSAFAFVLLGMDEFGVTHVIDELYLNRLTNDVLAAKVASLLSSWGVPLHIPIACDTSMWSPTRSSDGTWNGEKDIEAFWRAGLSGCCGADKNRQAGWSQVRRFLHNEGIFKVWKGCCPRLIERFPEMQYSEVRGKENDMDTDGDDHLHDALRYALMMRVVAPKRAAIDPVYSLEISNDGVKLDGPAIRQGPSDWGAVKQGAVVGRELW
jgi:hypothetical protein